MDEAKEGKRQEGQREGGKEGRREWALPSCPELWCRRLSPLLLVITVPHSNNLLVVVLINNLT